MFSLIKFVLGLVLVLWLLSFVGNPQQAAYEAGNIARGVVESFNRGIQGEPKP